MDVLKLRDWYRTPVGHMVRRVMQHEIDAMWPSVTGDRILLLGYGVPYADMWNKESQVIACMPGKVGVVHWPMGEPNRTLMGWESELPFDDDSFDKVLLIHGLEFSQLPEDTLNECYRVLKPQSGSFVTIVPNRLSAWSRMDRTPLGRGLPYSARQLGKIMRDAGFTVTCMETRLFFPPSGQKLLLRYADYFELAGRFVNAPFGGFVVSECRKEVFGGTAVRVDSKRAVPRMVMKPTA